MAYQEQTIIRLENLALPMSIGIHDHEKARPQTVLVSVDLFISSPTENSQDDIADVFNYEILVNGIKGIAAQGHINLIETFAEKIVSFCLAQPPVREAKVLVRKPEIFPDAESIGIELVRRKAS